MGSVLALVLKARDESLGEASELHTDLVSVIPSRPTTKKFREYPALPVLFAMVLLLP